MASEAAHLLRASRNEAFMKTVDATYPEWRVIAAFYVAVHQVEAFFARKNIHWTRHHERNQALIDYNDIYEPYITLFDLSRSVRYLDGYVSPEQVRDEVEGKLLKKIKERVAFHLGTTSPTHQVRGAVKRRS